MSASAPWERFSRGGAVPLFTGPIEGEPRYPLDTAAGRYILLGFHGAATAPQGAAMLAAVDRHRTLFDDDKIAFFGVTTDPADQASGHTASRLPGIRFFLDFDGGLSRGYTAVDADGRHSPFWLLLDPTLRVLLAAPVAETAMVMATLAALPPVSLHAGVEAWAPVLLVPRVFEPAFCQALVERHQRLGSLDSGIMVEKDGRTVGIYDYSRKRRDDHIIDDQALCAALAERIGRRLAPEVRRAFAFEATRLERHLIACYDGTTGGHFRAHRDNTTGGTAHRRFAITVNLNAEDYEGGDLRFPEFGARTYRAPTGGAIVFACGLLHEVLPVTRGRRYAYLPFMHDEAAERRRVAYLEGQAAS